MNVGSLFSGIGGFDLGLERAGMRILWQCEIDFYCRRVLAQHWPDIPCHTDIRTIDARTPRVHVLAGGFPCQPVSHAGQGLAQADERWLWPEFARVVGVLRPQYVLVENVPGLLGRGLGDVLGDLAALGYDAEWDCIPAQAVGAPHQRDRVWIVAYPARNGAGQQAPAGTVGQRARASGQQVADADSGGERWGQGPRVFGGLGPAQLRPAMADTDQERRRGRTRQFRPRRRRELADGGWWLTEPDVGRVAHGIPARVDRLRALGNSLVPQIAELIGLQILDYEAEMIRVAFDEARDA